MTAFSPKLPLKFENQQGYGLIRDLKTLSKQNFLMLLLTNPGERIMDGDFGVGIKRLLFENFSDSNIPEFESRLQSQVIKYLPYVKILNLDYGKSNQDLNMLYIDIKLFIVPLGSSYNITIQSDGSIITVD